MKKLLIAITLLLTTQTYAYTIGGAYASLVSCDYGQWGYQYGYIGTYEANGQMYQVFFGSSYCRY